MVSDQVPSVAVRVWPTVGVVSSMVGGVELLMNGVVAATTAAVSADVAAAGTWSTLVAVTRTDSFLPSWPAGTWKVLLVAPAIGVPSERHS